MTPQLIKNTSTDVTEFIDELGAGVVKEKLAAILSEASMGVVNYGEGNKKAKITLELTLSRFDGSAQLLVTHKIIKDVPTKRGKKQETDATSTVFFTGRGGELTIDAPKEDHAGQRNFGLEKQ